VAFLNFEWKLFEGFERENALREATSPMTAPPTVRSPFRWRRFLIGGATIWVSCWSHSS
jgi:hypothetical protein